MPPGIKDLLRRQRKVTFAFDGDEDYEVQYRPHVYDAALHDEFLAYAEARDNKGLVQILDKLLCGWNMTDDGQPWPLSPENMNKLPLLLLVAMGDAVMTDVLGGKDRDAGPNAAQPSSNGSSPMVG